MNRNLLQDTEQKNVVLYSSVISIFGIFGIAYSLHYAYSLLYAVFYLIMSICGLIGAIAGCSQSQNILQIQSILIIFLMVPQLFYFGYLSIVLFIYLLLNSFAFSDLQETALQAYFLAIQASELLFFIFALTSVQSLRNSLQIRNQGKILV